jgi:ribose transport system substrate-binding protein
LALLVAASVSACGALSLSEPTGPDAAKPNQSAALKAIVRAELAGKTPASVRKQLNSSPKLSRGQVVPGYPKGLPPSPANVFHFSASDIAKLKRGHHTAAIAMHLLNDAWPQLQIKGIATELKRFGIKVVATTDANFNASTQINNVDTLITRHPDVLFSDPVNPTTEGSTYKKVQAKGIKLILLDGVPNGLKPGKDFVTVVSANNSGDAEFATKQLAKALGGKGQIGTLDVGYYFYVVTVRDQTTRRILKQHPKMSVVKGSFSEPTTAAYNEAAGMLLAHPDMQGMWAAWDTVAQQVVAAERAQGRRIYLATSDLGAISGLQMAEGYIHAIGAQQPYKQGIAEADAAAYALLGKKVPPYIQLPTVPVTIESLIPAYKIVLRTDPPANLIAALKRTVGLS